MDELTKLLTDLKLIRKKNPQGFSRIYSELIGSFLSVCTPSEKLRLYLDILKNNIHIDEKTKIKFSYSNITEYQRVTRFRKSEPETKDWIDGFKSGDVFFDIGANVGFFSLYTAHKFNDVKIYSFEPHHGNYSSLFSNILLNNFSEKITPFNCGISDNNSIQSLAMRSTLAGSAKSVVGDQIDTFGNEFMPAIRINVPIFTIDYLVSELKIPQPNYIKIDVDGIEQLVLQGARIALFSAELKGVMVECSSQAEEEVISKYMEVYRFRIIKSQNKDYSGGHTKNLFFGR